MLKLLNKMCHNVTVLKSKRKQKQKQKQKQQKKQTKKENTPLIGKPCKRTRMAFDGHWHA